MHNLIGDNDEGFDEDEESNWPRHHVGMLEETADSLIAVFQAIRNSSWLLRNNKFLLSAVTVSIPSIALASFVIAGATAPMDADIFRISAWITATLGIPLFLALIKLWRDKLFLRWLSRLTGIAANTRWLEPRFQKTLNRMASRGDTSGNAALYAINILPLLGKRQAARDEVKATGDLLNKLPKQTATDMSAAEMMAEKLEATERRCDTIEKSIDTLAFDYKADLTRLDVAEHLEGYLIAGEELQPEEPAFEYSDESGRLKTALSLREHQN